MIKDINQNKQILYILLNIEMNGICNKADILDAQVAAATSPIICCKALLWARIRDLFGTHCFILW